MDFQSAKPIGGVFCYLINEARETTALEMPDLENTFVLKVRKIQETNIIFLYNIDKSLYSSSQSLQGAMVLSVSSVNVQIPS